jgi:uncharacterized protein (DUF1800 family)
MKRRQFLMNLKSIPSEVNINNNSALSLTVSGLDEYKGPWNKKTVAHLLRRTTFGFKFNDLENLEKEGLQKTISQLFTDLPFAELPLNYDFNDDEEVPLGSTWVNAKYGTNAQTSNYRFRSLSAWRVGRTYSGELSIKEKMVTFWINHFGVSNVIDANFLWRYINIFYSNFDGDFKKIIQEITVDPTMLRFLDGNSNTRRSPNENYAREFLELFTIGKGAEAGPGDYTNYTEKDIFELAKVFTGWRDFNYRNSTREGFGSQFTLNNHDITTKQLSNRFGNAVINNKGNLEYLEAIDIVFKQTEVSKFIARKLYRYFVYYKITPEIEQNVISPLAQIIREDNYVLRRALITLFSSEHFFDQANIGVMIKNPQDFMAHATVNLGLQLSDNYVTKYRYWYNTDLMQGRLQMRSFDLPSVAGWKAYYQEPTYYQGWINSVTLPMRSRVTDTFHSRTANTYSGLNVRIDGMPLLNSFPNPENLIDVLDNINTLLFPKPFNEKQIDFLKKVVVPPNGNEADWTKIITDWKANATNARTTDIRNRMYDLLKTISYMPEYQLS